MPDLLLGFNRGTLRKLNSKRRQFLYQRHPTVGIKPQVTLLDQKMQPEPKAAVCGRKPLQQKQPAKMLAFVQKLWLPQQHNYNSLACRKL